MNSKTRKSLGIILRIAICLIALWIVVRGVTINDRITLRDGTALVGQVQTDGEPVEFRGGDDQIRQIARSDIAVSSDGTLAIGYGLKTTLWRSNKLLLLAALAIYFPVLFPQALRLWWLLRAQAIPVGYMECLKVTVAGNFLNFATPFGSNAGDLFKAYFVSLHAPQKKTEAVTTVILDRFVGLATLLLVAGSITVLSPPGSRLAGMRPIILTMLTIGVIAFVVYRSRLGRRIIQSLPQWSIVQQLRRVDQAAHKLTGHVWALVAAFLLTFLLQGMALTAFFAIAIALAMKANLSNMPEYFAYFYTGTLISTLPGPPQGLGTVELAYRYFFAPYGTVSQIICMAFAIRLTGLVSALPGLFVTMTGAYRPRAGVIEVQDAVAEMNKAPAIP